MLAALACAALVAGCGSSDAAETDASAAPSADGTSAAAEDSVHQDSADEENIAQPTISGSYGETPEFAFPESEPSADLEVEVLSEGDGPQVEPGAAVLADYAGVVWGEADPFDSSFSRDEPTLFSLNQVVDGWTQGIPDHAVGSRLLISIPPELGYGPGGGNAAAGIGPEDTIVFVVDLVQTYNPDDAGQADAEPTTPTEELPVEVTGDLGEPAAVSIPDGLAAPEESEVIPIAEGNGPAVESGDTVVVAYAMSSWGDDTTQSTWPTDQDPGSGPITSPVGQGTVVDELTDMPVGSRVLLLIPQTQQGPASAFVMDIVGKA